MAMFDLLFPKHWSTLKKLIWLKAAALSSAVVKTVTAAIVHIKDALAGPAQNVTIAIEPVQSGSGDPSPDNVRPITGWTGANVYRTGANIWGGEKMANDFVAAINNASACFKGEDEDGAYVRFTAGAALNDKVIYRGPFKENTRYTFIMRRKKSNNNNSSNMVIVYTDGASGYIPIGDDYTTVKSYAFVSAAGKTIDHIVTIWGSGTTYLYYDDCGWFEGVLTVDDFQPYTGTTIPISFGSAGTVYGGTLDVTTGVLTVTHASVNMGSLSWSAAGIRFFSSGLAAEIKKPANNDAVADLLCSVYSAANYSQVYADTVDSAIAVVATPAGSAGQVSVRDHSASGKTGAEFKTAMSGVQLVYELATPQTYQLSPQEVQLLAGENNIWADTGNTILTYLADGRASDTEALGILLAGRYVNTGAADEATDAEALDILLGGTK